MAQPLAEPDSAVTLLPDPGRAPSARQDWRESLKTGQHLGSLCGGDKHPPGVRTHKRTTGLAMVMGGSQPQHR